MGRVLHRECHRHRRHLNARDRAMRDRDLARLSVDVPNFGADPDRGLALLPVDQKNQRNRTVAEMFSSFYLTILGRVSFFFLTDLFSVCS